jgi:acyl dehydratase
MTHPQYTVGMALPRHTIRAHNDATASANKIHDDTVAAQYGFRGGLVPGVTVYAYMTYPLVQSFGEAWLTRGTATVQLARPFYHGDQVTVSGIIRDMAESGLTVELRSTNADGIACGLGTARLPKQAAAAAVAVPCGPEDRQRIPVSWDALMLGVPLPSLTLTVSQSDHQEYCRTHGDDLAMYQGAHGCVHPGLLLHQCNRIFSERFILGPWMHVASDIHTYRPCQVGETLEVRGMPIDKFVKKGHEFVVLDVCILSHGEVAQRVKHTCIFRPRKG